jgi:hypothetical protein
VDARAHSLLISENGAMGEGEGVGSCNVALQGTAVESRGHLAELEPVASRGMGEDKETKEPSADVDKAGPAMGTNVAAGKGISKMDACRSLSGPVGVGMIQRSASACHAMRAALAVEAALMWQRYGMITEASRSLQDAAEALGVRVGTCGVLGTRTEFQTNPTAQLVLKFKRLDCQMSEEVRELLGGGRPLEEVEPQLEGGSESWAGWKDDSGVHTNPRLIDADGVSSFAADLLRL